MAIFPSVGSRISFTLRIMVKTGTSARALRTEEDNLSAPGPVMFMAGIVSIVVIISLNVRNALTIVCSPPHVPWAPVMVTTDQSRPPLHSWEAEDKRTTQDFWPLLICVLKAAAILISNVSSFIYSFKMFYYVYTVSHHLENTI